MKANELRIGNFVSLFGLGETVEFPLTEPRFIRVLNGEYKVEPIPLTEEWLVKFGFEFLKKKSGTQGVHTNGKMNLVISNCGNVYRINQPVRYVHHLQNLYFALTGEELIINKDQVI
jgi:hypothetical protein